MMQPLPLLMFDVDSTLVTIEGLDHLAEQKGVGEKVKALTTASMEGTVPLEEVFEKKINLLAPTQKELQKLSEYYIQNLTEDARTTLAALHYLQKEIWLVTGSFCEAIKPLATYLQIPHARVRTNHVTFTHDGLYHKFDREHPLYKQFGKAVVAKEIAKDRPFAFIGDSVTDLAVMDHCTIFIGYGGVTKRERVMNEAQYFITQKSLCMLLPLLLTAEETAELADTPYIFLIEKARQLQRIEKITQYIERKR